MTHIAVSLKSLTKQRATLAAALAAVDALLATSAPTATPKPERKKRTRDEKIVAPEGGFQP